MTDNRTADELRKARAAGDIAITEQDIEEAAMREARARLRNRRATPADGDSPIDAARRAFRASNARRGRGV